MLPLKMYRNSRSCLSSSVRNRYDFLEIFTVFSPRQRPDLAIHKFTKLISENQEIPFYGDGSTARDYTFIEDIIDGVVKSVKYIENHHNVYRNHQLKAESRVVNSKRNGDRNRARTRKICHQKICQCNLEM